MNIHLTDKDAELILDTLRRGLTTIQLDSPRPKDFADRLRIYDAINEEWTKEWPRFVPAELSFKELLKDLRG